MIIIVGNTISSRELAARLGLRIDNERVRITNRAELMLGFDFDEIHYTHDASTELRLGIEERARRIVARTGKTIPVIDHADEINTLLWLEDRRECYSISRPVPKQDMSASQTTTAKRTPLAVAVWSLGARLRRGV